MLSFQDFFAACAGVWATERTYHFVQKGEIERSYTEFKVNVLTAPEKQRILTPADHAELGRFRVDSSKMTQGTCPGFAIAFDTVSDKGERVAMSLNALFVPDDYISLSEATPAMLFPLAAQVPAEMPGEVTQGFYLRDEGYSEAGAIAGRFTYQSTRQTLEMTTPYKRSVAVDQMRLLSPTMRLRTIVTYERPEAGEVPSVITLIGFGVEQKQ